MPLLNVTSKLADEIGCVVEEQELLLRELKCELCLPPGGESREGTSFASSRGSGLPAALWNVPATGTGVPPGIM